MTTTPAVLIEPAFVDATGLTYTSDNCLTALDKVGVTNEGVASAVAIVKLYAPDGTRVQTYKKTVLPDASWPFPDIVGHVLDIGGKVNVSCATANTIKPRISGRKFT
jgi:hypothetical protein